MPLSMMVMVSVMLVVAAVIQCFATLGFRRGIFFGVTVDPEFPQSENARQIVWRYRLPILVMAVVCIVALWIVVPRLSGIVAPLSMSGIIFLEVGTGMISMARTTKYARAFAKPHSPVRTVSLTPLKRALPGGYLPFAGPLIIVGLGFFLVLMRKNAIAAETSRGALSLLYMALIWDVFILWVAWMAAFRMRQTNSADRRAGYLFRLVMTYVLTVFWVYMGLAIANIVPVIKGMGPMVFLFVISPVMGAILIAYAAKRRKEEAEANGESFGDTTPDASWKWGFIYYNPSDPALVVPTRSGRFGCDLNFGNKWSQVVCAVILATPFLIRLILF